MKTLLQCAGMIVLTMFALLMIPSCSTLEKPSSTARAAVTVGTLKYIGEDREKARRVEKTALDVLASMSGGTTIEQLDQHIRNKINWSRLDLADRILLDALLRELSATITASIGEGLLSDSDKVRIERVAEWVIAAARMAQ